MKLSVIIVSYNAKKVLVKCLSLLEKRLSGNFSVPESEIIIVDNNSKDGAKEWLEKQTGKYKTAFLKENIGFGRANNVGLQLAMGDYILYLNSDVCLEESIDFESPRFAMRVGGTYGGADPRGYFFYSYDAGISWKGPYGFGDLINHPEMKKYGLEEITPRTDYIVTRENECIVMMSAREKGKFGSDRLFSIKTEDGGKTFQFLGWVIKPYREDEINATIKVALYDDPDKNPYATECRAVMSQTQLLSGGKLITVMRRKYTAPDGDAINSENWVDAYASVDGGKTWTFQSMAGNGGKGNGNPPALAISADGRLCTVFGEREFGTIQVAYSSDEGKSWSAPQILFDGFWSEDMELADMGYPRVLARSDGKMIAIYYYSTKEYLHHIHATIWNPN